MIKFFKKIYDFFYYEIAWHITQYWGYHYGKHKENITANGKNGFLFVNSLNKTFWFHPYDNSFDYETYICKDAYVDLKKHFFG